MLPYTVTICGLDELPGHADAGVSHVLSFLDPDWPDPDAFDRYAQPWRHTFRVHDISIAQPGKVLPGAALVDRLLEIGATLQGAAVEHLLVHCHAGISRSTAATAILMAQAAGPAAVQVDEVFAAIRRIRPFSWPNERMIRLADEAMGLDGRLRAGLQRHRDVIATDNPTLAPSLPVMPAG